MTVPQIFDRNMKRLAYLDNAISVGYTLEANSLWTATFTMPAVARGIPFPKVFAIETLRDGK